MMSQESLARSWEFVEQSQIVGKENEKEESEKEKENKENDKETQPQPPPQPETPPPPPQPQPQTPPQPQPQPQPQQHNCLDFLFQTLSKDGFSQVLAKVIEDSVTNAQKGTNLIFELPSPTLNSTEAQKNIGLAIINTALPTLFSAMNPKTAALCVELVRKVAEHFNFLLRYTPYKDLFFVNADYLCTGQELGRGKFATVYEGRHTLTGQKLAIKVMDKQKLVAEDPRVEEFLQRETSIMKSLEHPSVVRLYDVLETPTSLFLVMEFCPGGTLADYLVTKKVLPEEEVQRYVRQIASGLQYMRARSVSHRDLKPANLLLVETPYGERVCKITDFTFARFLNPGEISKTLVGSPLYMAPEIFNNYQYDGMADLWSVGVIMFEMLMGQVPFPANTLVELIGVLRSTDPVIPPHIKLSTSCRQLLHGLLQKEPKKRITWEAFFSHPWLTGAVATVPTTTPKTQYTTGMTSSPTQKTQYNNRYAQPPVVVTHQYNNAAQDTRVRQLEAEVKGLKEKEENMKQFIQDQQRYMQEQNTRIEQYRAASEALQDRVKKLTTELAEAKDAISAYEYAFNGSFSAP